MPNFTLIREYLGVSNPENVKNCNPLPDVGAIRRVYAGNWSTEAVNIWCDLVGKLGLIGKNRDGAFPPNIFTVPYPVEKNLRCKNGTDILYLHAKFGADVSF